MKIDPFAPESARESVEILYPLKAIRLGTVNALPPISLLRSNSARQTFLGILFLLTVLVSVSFLSPSSSVDSP